MKILLNDYGHYPFIFQLATKLAERGYQVMYCYNSSLKRPTVKGFTPENFIYKPINVKETPNNTTYLKRYFSEVEYGKKCAKLIYDYMPDLLLSTNTPLNAQIFMSRICKQKNIKNILWVQDLLGLATYIILGRKYSLIGKMIGKYYILLEKKIFKLSDKIILIDEAFKDVLNFDSLSRDVIVIPNWAPILNLSDSKKNNFWSRKHNLDNKYCFLYAGNLGKKHNPSILLKLAIYYRNDSDVAVVVVGEGAGITWLESQKNELNLSNLYIMPFQDSIEFSSVLATGDVLVAILNSDASDFSIPSKVLTYLSSNRPILLCVPLRNRISTLVKKINAGLVSEPENIDKFIENAEMYRSNPHLAKFHAKNGYEYAKHKFDIDCIANEFISIF